MLPINETLAHFSNIYGGSSLKWTIEIYELKDFQRTPRLFKAPLTSTMDINSFMGNIEAICDDINATANGSLIELIDVRSGRPIQLQTSDVLTYSAFRVEVTVNAL
ncbi:hypothetical protein [Paenibacillus daejeonensis]|uniref:hypothetical protein n=1 Tax=Paenibacillus daejeonensis TaxID=135193 RepID=UPI000380B94F|nr:hypothetical protein [Paenibacillus daejeonensis]